MKFKSPITRKWLTGGMGILLTIGIGWLLMLVTIGKEGVLGQKLIRWSYDLPFVLRTMPVEDVALIQIDEASHKWLYQDPLKPWDRVLHAKLLDRLRQAGARMIVMDIIFIGQEDTSGALAATDALASAIKAHGNVILAAEYAPVQMEASPEDRYLEIVGYQVFPPDGVFTAAAADYGIASLAIDVDYAVREHYQDPEGNATLSQVAAARQLGVPLPHRTGLWVNYYGPAGHLKHFSYHQALDPELTNDEEFRDKVVFIGKAPMTGLAGALKDEYLSPYSWAEGTVLGGVEIHATEYLNLVRGDWLRRLAGGWELLILWVAGAFLGYTLCLFRPTMATLLAIPIAVAVAFGNYFAFTRFNYWFPWLIIVMAQIPVALAWSVLLNSIKLHVEKKNLEHSLHLHLSPNRVQQILRRPELLKPGAEKQEITILFTDIANFSRITGRMDPGDLFQLLNNYFEIALGCIHKTDGTVIKLIGDAIFAIWNAPFQQKDHQARACQTALLLRDTLVEFDLSKQSLPLHTRIGLHTSEAFIGNVGSSTRFDYTAIGDGINLASRLEGLNKFLGTDILATRDTQKWVEDAMVSRLVGHFRFKGFDRIVEVHELLDDRAHEDKSRDWRGTFEKALYHFQRGSFDEAESGFKRTIELRGDDGPAKFYLNEISQYRTHPPPTDWAGEVIIREK